MSNQNQIITLEHFKAMLEEMDLKKVRIKLIYHKKRYCILLYIRLPNYHKKMIAGKGKTISHAIKKILVKLQAFEELENYFNKKQISVIDFKHYPKDWKTDLLTSFQFQFMLFRYGFIGMLKAMRP